MCLKHRRIVPEEGFVMPHSGGSGGSSSRDGEARGVAEEDDNGVTTTTTTATTTTTTAAAGAGGGGINDSMAGGGRGGEWGGMTMSSLSASNGVRSSPLKGYDYNSPEEFWRKMEKSPSEDFPIYAVMRPA